MPRRKNKTRAITPHVRMRAIMPRELEPTPPTEHSFRPSLNAVLFLACILFAGLWTWLYSDWFAVFSGTIGLTTLLGVVPSVRSYMSQDRDKRYEKALDNLLFQNSRATYVHAATLGLILIIGFGLFQPITLQVINTSGAATLSVTLSWAGSEKTASHRLFVEAGKSHRLPVLRPQAGGPDTVKITAKALPVVQRDLSSFGWSRVLYPVDFWKAPVVLLYPSPTLLRTLRDRQPTLQVKRISANDVVQSCDVQSQYLGEPVWIGTGGRVLPIATRQIASWREAAVLQGIRSKGVTGLEERVIGTPIAAQCVLSLGQGDILQWELSSANGSETLFSGNVVLDDDHSYPIEHAMK